MMSATAPGSPLVGPPSYPWLEQFLQSCLVEPSCPTLRLFPEAQTERGVDEPLYKLLARALLALTLTESSAPSTTIFHHVTTLTELISSVRFRLHVQEPFFSQLKDGSKSVEGRCAVGDYNRIGPGDLLLFNSTLIVVVKRVKHYDSFRRMLEVEGMDHVLPGITSINEGAAIYRQFYSEEKELSGGVLAIHVEGVAEEMQPLTIVRTILKELGTWDADVLRGFVMNTED